MNISNHQLGFHSIVRAARFQEFERFKKFGESLLSKSTKLAEVIGDLEAALEESGKGEDSGDGRRVAQPIS